MCMAERNLNLDKQLERKGTHCLKYDFAKRRGKPEDVLPLWVADMDFPTTSYVEDILQERTKHGIYGYSEVGEEYFNVLKRWMKKHHDWDIEPNWIIKTPGVVFALAMAIRAFTKEGEGVLIQQPVYYPFSEVIEDNGRVIVSNDLVLGEDYRYRIDFEDFEKKIIEHNIRLFLLCNPHNPSGRVFTKEELKRMGDICLKHNVIVVSDEIHHDFVFEGEHTVFANLGKEYQEISIVCTSASKTFNLASMLISNIFIPNQKLRRAIRKQVNAVGISQLSILGLLATQEAYDKGEEWYQNVHNYLWDNIVFTRNYVKEFLPGVEVIHNEGTYLVWLDFRNTGIDPEELERRVVYEAKLWLDSGSIFGKAGDGFQRINVATQREVLLECLERIRYKVLDR